MKSRMFITVLTVLVLLPSILFAQTSQLVNACSNFGLFGDPNANQPSGEFPAESGKYYLYQGSYWVGAVMDGTRHVTHADYGFYEWQPSEDSTGQRYEHELVTVGIDTFVHPAMYDDYLNVDGHTPLGLTVYQSYEAFATGDGPDQAHLLIQYLDNTGGNDLDSVYIGWRFDFDVAAGPNGDITDAHMDDWCSYQPERQLAYMWDGDDPNEEGDDTGEDGEIPGYVGIAVLESDMPVCSYQWWDWDEDPGSDDEKFQFMAGIHPASNGEAFRADPETVFDYRVLLTTGPYTLNAGDAKLTVITFAAGDGMDGLNDAIDEMIAYYQTSVDNPFSERAIPQTIYLAQPYPNPFNSTTRITITVKETGNSRVEVFDLQGRLVETVAKGSYTPGTYRTNWSPSGIASGMYIVRYTNAGQVATRKVVLVQ